MGEFVGIDPSGAHDLIHRLEAGEGLLGSVRPLLDAAVAEAGEDWSGRHGTAALARVAAFLQDARRELRWRIDAAEQLVPVRERGLIRVAFPFAEEAEATRAAGTTAAAVLAALGLPPPAPGRAAGASRVAGTSRSGDAAPPGSARPGALRALADERASAVERATVIERALAVERALAGDGAVAGDPAYAAALLAALGPDGLVLALRCWTEAEAAGEREGLPPAALARAAAASPGLLARAFAAAERTARLGEEWRELPVTAPADVLTTLLALGRPSGAFLTVVAVELLNRRPDAGPDWNLHHLVHACRARPEAFQELLAEHPKETGVLLDAYALGTHPAYERALAGALHAALEPGAGADGLRERAWLGLVGALDGEHPLWHALEPALHAGGRP
ncbi:hypothetical protein MF672_041015 [Actinomadura sp. ATCC 31491]|uniref:Uncharacterized protein n=1 Tax=Actinomadura luzonensis TaxID=2805427 RepID=A0ABT0G6C9_9ACTN|nr:hypothetical protein [Actinomadura luzonensis]MCK2220135.1 hypothetical protein [Actinomadura luzonensis]